MLLMFLDLKQMIKLKFLKESVKPQQANLQVYLTFLKWMTKQNKAINLHKKFQKELDQKPPLPITTLQNKQSTLKNLL